MTEGSFSPEDESTEKSYGSIEKPSLVSSAPDRKRLGDPMFLITLCETFGRNVREEVEELEKVRLEISEAVVSKYLNGLRAPLEVGGKWGIEWGILEQTVTRMKKNEIDPTTENIVIHLKKPVLNIFNSWAKGSFSRGEKRHIPPITGRIKMIPGGGMGVAGRSSRKSRGT